MEKIIIANFKMNLTKEEILSYIENVKKIDNNRFIVCPTSIYVSLFLDEKYSIGLQNICEYNKGAYTGEISASQASSMGIKYVIVGHSERRHVYNETIESITKKINEVTSNNMTAIICDGELEEERKNNKTKEVLMKQLVSLKERENDNIIIAYEPVWAIGTSLTPTNEDILEATEVIKKESLKYGLNNVPVLYGGSVNLNNIEELNKVENVDGFLIGGCSLKPENMLKIVEVTKK